MRIDESRQVFDVLIVGAGWAGLSAAVALQEAGFNVCVLEKGRGPGGRCATRRHEGWVFDHGAQYFTARSQAFAEAVRHWERMGWVIRWDAPIAVIGKRPVHLEERDSAQSMPRWVGIEGNNSVLRQLSERVPVRFSEYVQSCQRIQDTWHLQVNVNDQVGHYRSRQLVVTAPPNQAAELIGADSKIYPLLKAHVMMPTWALLIGFDSPIPVDPRVAFVNTGPIAWFCAQATKPNRGREAWVVHATPHWSREHLEQEPEDVAAQLFEAWCALVGDVGLMPSYLSAHRWRYALSDSPNDHGVLHDETQAVWVAGDWCCGDRVEGAWLSGQAVAASLTSECASAR